MKENQWTPGSLSLGAGEGGSFSFSRDLMDDDKDDLEYSYQEPQ